MSVTNMKSSLILSWVESENPNLTADIALIYTQGSIRIHLPMVIRFLSIFYAPWCGTCRSQERTVAELRLGNPDYGNIKVIRADWNQHSKSELVRELTIPRRPMLVMFKDGKEISRIIVQTSKQSIEALFVDAGVTLLFVGLVLYFHLNRYSQIWLLDVLPM